MTKPIVPKRTPKSQRQRDWVAIKAAYVEGVELLGRRIPEPTLEDLHLRFQVPESTLRKRSMSEKWADARRLFQKRVEDARREQSADILASKGAEFDSLTLRVAEKLLAHVEKTLDTVPKDKRLPASDARALAGTLKDAQTVGRLIMGDSTENAKLVAELLQKPDLSMLTADDLEQLEALLAKAKPAAAT